MLTVLVNNEEIKEIESFSIDQRHHEGSICVTSSPGGIAKRIFELHEVVLKVIYHGENPELAFDGKIIFSGFSWSCTTDDLVTYTTLFFKCPW